MTYRIPEDNFTKFEKKIHELIRKAERYPECTINYEVLGETYEERTVDGFTDTYKFIEVEVNGIIINEGWTYVATIEKVPGERNVIIQSTNLFNIPEEYYTCELTCDHCKRNVPRKDTYLVYNKETKEFKQVGSSCLKEYTCGLSSEVVAEFNSIIQKAEDFEDITHYSKTTYHTTYGLVRNVLRYAYPLVQMKGYIPAYDRYGEFNRENTRDAVRELYNHYEKPGYESKVADKLISEGYDLNNIDERFISDALDWIDDCFIDEGNTYLKNVQNVCSAEYVDMDRNLGLVVSLINAYNKELERRAREDMRRAEADASEYFGKVGQRISIIPKSIEAVTSVETMYGLMTIWKITDEEGHIFIWKTSTYINPAIDVNEIIGTIKAHNEFRGVKQTELTRCKVKGEVA